MQRNNYRNVDLTGYRKGKLTVLKKAETGRTTWICSCECGEIVELKANVLINSKQISCGCAFKENYTTFGKRNTTHGDSYTKLYKTWRAMIDRCYNPKIKSYKNYGDRGITVCDEWLKSYENFRDWAFSTGYVEGLDRTHQSIDRIDVNGNYCPENCRWATAKTQQKNRRNIILYEYKGKSMTISEFADKYGITDKSFVYRKIKKGLSLEDILKEWDLKNNIPNHLIKLSKYAEIENITCASAARRINNGKIKGKKIGRKWYVIRKE